jgi:hypothetical protein
MRTSLLTTLSLAAASFLTPSTFAQSTWQTVDDFQYAPGQSAGPFSITATPDGAIFVSGAAVDAANHQHGFVNRSLDGGDTWDLVFDLPGVSSANCFAVAAAPSGTLWATSKANAINGRTGAWYGTWLAHRSTDGGATWILSDSFRGAGQEAAPFCTAVDAAGRVFVGGLISDAQGKQHFLTRRSLDGGTTWTTVDDVVGTTTCSVWDLTATPAGVFAAGRISTTWTVRRSTDGGSTWTTVDKYGAGNSYAYGIDSDVNGNVYVTGGAGITVNKINKTHWITRKSADGGTTWRVVDDVASGSFNNGRAATVDAYGRVFVAGQVVIGNTNHWITRGSTDGGATWVITDDYAPSATGAVLPRGATSDAVGNVFIGGQANGTDGVQHAIVRKLAAP